MNDPLLLVKPGVNRPSYANRSCGSPIPWIYIRRLRGLTPIQASLKESLLLGGLVGIASGQTDVIVLLMTAELAVAKQIA
jgi:hypothetical protein